MVVIDTTLVGCQLALYVYLVFVSFEKLKQLWAQAKIQVSLSLTLCVCVCVRACARACVRACVRVCGHAPSEMLHPWVKAPEPCCSVHKRLRHHGAEGDRGDLESNQGRVRYQAQQEREGGGDEVLETVRARVEPLRVILFAHQLCATNTDAWATSARHKHHAGDTGGASSEGRE